MVRQTTKVEHRTRTSDPVTVRGIAGWVFLAVFVTVLLTIAAIALFYGLPYYLTPDAERPDHPLDELFAPGSAIGLLLGMTGATLMVMLLVYSVRKWFPFLSFMGTPRFWMRFHLVCGLLGPLFIVLHGAINVPSGFIGVGFWCMLLVASSGFFGRYLFGYLPATAADRRLDLDTARESLAELRAQLVEETRAEHSGLVGEALSLVRDFDHEAHTLLELLFLDAEVRHRADIVKILLRRASLDPAVRRKAESTLVAQLRIRRSIAGYEAAKRTLRFWNLLHQPLAAGMYSIAALHVLNAVLFGGAIPIVLELFR